MRACLYSFFFNDTATTEIYTLSLHDALPISSDVPISAYSTGSEAWRTFVGVQRNTDVFFKLMEATAGAGARRSEEHTSELQARPHLVLRRLPVQKRIRIERP